MIASLTQSILVFNFIAFIVYPFLAGLFFNFFFYILVTFSITTIYKVIYLFLNAKTVKGSFGNITNKTLKNRRHA